jgi:hypothetical protein
LKQRKNKKFSNFFKNIFEIQKQTKPVEEKNKKILTRLT